jgi:hypothetical protein
VFSCVNVACVAGGLVFASLACTRICYDLIASLAIIMLYIVAITSKKGMRNKKKKDKLCGL